MAMQMGPCRLVRKRRRPVVSTGVGEDAAEGGVDRISELPDDVLGDIVSLLPTNEGACTQILKRRWRQIWRFSAPLNLDCCAPSVTRGRGSGARSGDEAEAAEHACTLISHILSSHKGPCRRFCVPSSFRFSNREATVEAWLQSPALDNLQELDLWSSPSVPFALNRGYLPLQRSTIFRFSSTLRVATIAYCHLPDSTVLGLQFPQLKQLGLIEVFISEHSLHHIIAACPALECLMIRSSWGFLCVRIHSFKLRSIGVSARSSQANVQFVELVIVNAPCLKRVLHLDMNATHLNLHIKVISAPKLETLRCHRLEFSPSTKLSFHSAAIQGLHNIGSLTTAVRTVKILAVEMETLCLDTIIDFMRCFPCLEKLYVEPFGILGANNLWRRKHRNVIKSFDIRLKTIVLGYYRGNQSDINFATFFVMNARFLELMTFEVRSKQYNKGFLAEQEWKLQLDKRASKGAQFHFTTDRCVRGMPQINHPRDLDLTDPFKF